MTFRITEREQEIEIADKSWMASTQLKSKGLVIATTSSIAC
jgi:hypothetical protein